MNTKKTPLPMAALFAGLLLLVARWSAQGAEASARTLRVYFVGNSVTDTLRYRELAKLAATRDIKITWGRHMIPGAPLEWLYRHPNDGFREDPYGGWQKALSEFAWDAVSLQPFDRHLHSRNEAGEDLGDAALIAKLGRLAATKNPEVQVYIFARWPRVTVAGKNVPFDKNDYDPTKPGSGNDLSQVDDFTARWNAKYTGGWDASNETRDYFETLLREVRKDTPEFKKPVLLVPVGHVLAELHAQMKAGKVPGWTSVHQFYKDAIHLNEPGSYAVACTYFATLLKQSPVGLPTEFYGKISPELARVIQETAWRVVQTTSEAGVTKIVVDFTQTTGAQGEAAKYGLNLFKVYNPAMSQQNPAYKRELARMAPGYIRIHSWNMMGDSGSGDGWIRDGAKATYRWDEKKILAALKGVVPKRAKGMMNIPAWPAFLGSSDQPLPAVNTAAFAAFCAQLVQIVNIEGGYGLKYWEVTNERDDVYKGKGTALANLVLEAARAMKKVDPTILVGGPALIQPWQDLVNDFLATAAGELDFISYHTYATDDANAPLQGLFDHALGLGGIALYMNGEIAKHTQRRLEVFHNEYNISYAPPDQRMSNIDGAIFDAMALIGFAESEITGSAAWNEADGWYGKLDGDLQPKPASFVYELFNKHAIGKVVKAASNAPKTIQPLAILGASGKALFLVNRTGTAANVDVSGFADRKAQAAQVTKDGLAQVTLPPSGSFMLPAMSLTVFTSTSK